MKSGLTKFDEIYIMKFARFWSCKPKPGDSFSIHNIILQATQSCR